ncbi:leucine-rich repeat and guanylate kinase domain-containing protein-like [Neodiprion fabricii]|uniref:leucine-rich repeat and guanylate kinase domain-containing protein-like n=1 Tax=Neodiprion fabricii TaxID=2872261 RepID=UPI001ED91BFD|nr:leucine-rich repeat and guanylate kinase domain-containing protein-like [Neodiprion fabricii]
MQDSMKRMKSLSFAMNEEFSGWREYSLPILYPNLESDKENKQRIIESKWGRGTALDIGLWEDSIAPVVKVRSRVDIDLGVSEVTDVLTDEMVGACSSFLAKSPETELYVENKCELVNMGLRDIFILQYRHYLQYIDLENNSIGDLTPLGGIPYLMYLNAARNKLRDVLRFKPPWCLTYVNLAYNNISKIDDLSEFWSIVRLDLSHNVIERIEGLVNLRHLRFLNLGYNIIESVENLDNLDIQELNLEYNCISNVRSATSAFGISTLPNLRTLILRHNKLTTLEFFEGAYGLRYIDLKYNKISDLLEVSHLKSLVHEIDFRGNPCTNWPNYRDVLLFSMPSVMFVDGASVTISEKVSASTIFAPPIELVVASSVTKLMLLEHLNTIDIDLHITPIDQSTPPLIILTGPPAVKKSILAKKIANDLPKRVRYCLSHTTKHQPCDDPLGSTYHFVSREEFNEITRRGEFLSTREWLGNSYGFHVSEIKALALDKKIGITHMDLHAALQMQSRYVNAKLILVLTKSEELHRLWIQEKIQIFTWVKSSLQNLVTFKLEKYRRPTIEMKESTSPKVNFIYELLNEVLETLDSSPFSTTMGSEVTEEMDTVMVMESQTTLPEIIKTSSDIEMEKKHITFQGEDEQSTTAPSSNVTFNSDKLTVPMPDELKVILDEHSNVIIENEEDKRRRLKEKIRLQHDLLRLQMDNDEFVEGENLEDYSASSDDLFVSKRVSSQVIRNMQVLQVLL